jgi:hypothetical protein
LKKVPTSFGHPMSDRPSTPLLALTGFLPAWDLEKRTANVEPIIAWTLKRLREMGHPAERLDLLHQHLSPAQALAAGKSLTASSLESDLREHVCRAVLEAIPELSARRVWIQTRAHFRILVPNDTVAPVPPHTDFGFGHQLDERNVWFSLTNVESNAALHAHSLTKSLTWMARTGTLYGVLDGVPDPPPIPTRVGEVLLFTPLHVHRARAPDENQCRVSFDVRIVPASGTPTDLTFSPLYEIL